MSKKGYKLVPWLFGKEIEIPEEWNIKKIKDITKVSVGLVINPSTYFDDDGMVPMITGKNVTENGIVLDNVDFITEKSNKLLETTRIWSGDLVTMRVGYPGRTSVVKNEHDGINCASVIITRRSKKFVSEFLGYLANSKLMSKQIIMHQAGGAQQVVNIGSWKEFLIPFPSINEQQQIASILSNIDSLIESTSKIIKNSKSLKTGLMQKLLTRGISHTKFKKVPWLFGKEIEIPEDWEIKMLDDVGNLSAGGTPSRFNLEYWNNGTIPWLSSGEIRNNIITESDEKITSLGLKESASRLFPKGTVLIAITGQGLTRGRTALLSIDASSNQSVIGIICKKDVIYNLFLWYYLQNEYWKLRSISQGSNQAGLNLNLLKTYQIILPSIHEQQKIATILSNIDAQINSQTQYKDKLERLKKSLMQKLLTGEVRV